MRIDPDTCRDPDLLAAEVRRLQGVIAARESAGLSQNSDCPGADNAARQDKVGRTLARRLVSRLRVLGDDSRKVYGLHAADCAAAMDEAASHIELLEAAYKSSGSALAVIDGGFKSAVAEVARLRLTDEERAAVSRAYDMLYERAGQLQATGNIAASTPFVQSAKALQRLWARLGGGE